MSPQEAKRKVSVERWKTIIQDRIDSGLMVKEYCVRNSISRDAYFYWLRIIREEALEHPAQISHGFVEISLPEEEIHPAAKGCAADGIAAASDGAAWLDLSVNGISVHVTDQTSTALLIKTLEVIRHVK